MSFSINTNISSLEAQNYLSNSSQFQSHTINEVTSGLRIVNSGDDAAGLAVANGLRSDQAVLNQGIQNGNNGLATLQTVDSGMNNIGTLLDRARTLATESASGTFTGDRGTLNSEFQSVISEITRQATSIGMNQGGQFAQNLSVFIGGGQGATAAAATQNGTINLNLANASVDAQSLGLQGVQATGKAGTDISAGSANTSVSQILANSANSGSENVPGFTTFSFSGPGFSDSSKINVSVNLAGVSDPTTLASAINSAIASEGNSGSQSATAFKNANITASVVTDSQGHEQLAFSSSNAAFQVQAGDQMSNALLGNFSQNAAVTGSTSTAAVDTSAGGAANALSFKFDGSSTAVTVNIAQGSAADSKADIVKQLNANAGFSAQGTASLQGDQIVIKSLNNSATSAVQVTSTSALTTALGLTAASATAAPASTGAALTTTVTGASAVNNNASIMGATVGSSTVIAAAQGATAAVLTGTAAPDAAIAALNSNTGTGVAATAAVLTGAAAPDAAIAALNGGNGTNADTLVLTVNGTDHNVTINSGDSSLDDIKTDINTAAVGVTASISGTGNNQQLVLTSTQTGSSAGVTVKTLGTTAELLTNSVLGFAGGESASGAAAQNDTLVLNVNGTSHNVTINQGDTTLNAIKTDINTAAVGVTASISGTGNNQKLVLTSTQTGSSAGVTVVTLGTSSDLLTNSVIGFAGGETASGSAATSANSDLNISTGSGAGTEISLASGTYTAAQLVTQLNTQLQAGSVAAKASLDADNHLVLTSTQPGQSITLNSPTSNSAYSTLGLTNGTSSTALFTSNDSIQVQISGGGISSPVTLAPISTTAGTTKVSDVVASLKSAVEANSQLAAAGITVSTDSTGDNLVLTGKNGEQFNVAVTGDTNNELGFGSFTTNASASNAVSYSDITGSTTVPTSPQTGIQATGSLNISLNGGATVGSINVALKSQYGTVSGATTTDGTVAGASLANTDKVSVLVNGAQKDLTLSSTDNTLAKVAATINTQTGSTGVTADVVTDNSGNQSLRLTATGGSGSSVTVEGVGSGNTTAAALTATGLTAGQSNTGLASASAVADDAVSQINAAIAGNATLSAAGITAINNGGSIELSSSNNTDFRVSGSGATDLGFGIGGGTYSGTAVSSAPVAGRVDAQGAYTSGSMAFSALANGGDSQSVSITADDTSGAAHALTVSLQNNSTSGSGANIDSAINAINKALQQSDDSTLQSVYAVKEDNADGTQSINFMSTTQNFKVAVSSTTDGSGITAPTRGIATAAQNGAGSTSDISTQAGAEAAVNALATAVQNLGTAQAAVGKGENLLNYAISLATSQTTNEAAAESNIRDANLAQEAANLSRAQILVQAGTAALAQANSAPQQLLSLLQH